MSTLFIRVHGPVTQPESPSSALGPSTDDASLAAMERLGEPAIPALDASETTEFDPELSADWLISESNGDVRAEGTTDLRGLSEIVDPDTDWLKNPVNVVLLVPSALVLNINCQVPGKNASQVRRALPFAVEEFVATDIEAMHVAAGDISRGGMIRSQVVDREILDNWLSALHGIEVRPGFAFSEAEMLPCSEGHSTLLFDDDEVLMKNVESAACIDTENLEFVLGSFVEASGEDAVIEVVNGKVDPIAVAQLPPDIEFTNTPLEAGQSVLSYLAGLWNAKSGSANNTINLLQGEYAVRMSAEGKTSRWRMVGMLAAGWFGIAMIALAAKGLYSDGAAGGLKAENESLYKDIYPETQRIPPNIQRDVQSRMGGSGSAGASFVPLIGRLTAHINKDIKVRSFNFQGTRDELSTELIVSGFDTLDKLKEQLTQDNLTVEISSADQQSDGVHARLRLRTGNAQ